MAYKERKDSAIASAERDLGGHFMRDGLVRSFRFNSVYVNKRYDVGRKGDYPFAAHQPKEGSRFGYNSNCAFTLTWTPGQMVITGDCGDLTLTHYNAMGDFEEAISWAQHSDFDYLLGKSNHHREYDAETTKRDFRRHLNMEIVQGMLGYQGFNRRIPGQIDEVRAWRKFRDQYDGDTQSWLEDKPYDGFTFNRHHNWRSIYMRSTDQDDAFFEIWEIPDEWKPWVKLWKWNQRYYFADINIDKPDQHPTYVLKAKNRHELWEEVEGHLDNQHDAMDLFRAIDFDDYYGQEDYSWRSYYLIACIQHGCRLIQQQLNLKEVA